MTQDNLIAVTNTETNECGEKSMATTEILPPEPQDAFSEDEIREIQEKYEPFLIFSDAGKLKRVSELFLAELYRKHRDVVFCQEENSLYQYCHQDGLWK